MATTQAKSPLSSESEGELFEVESILGKRTKHGKVEYLVRWKGFGQNEDSWEPVKNLKGCSALIKKYSKTRSPSPGRKAKKSQVILQSQRKQDVTPRKSQRKQDVTEEYTKLKTPKTAEKSDYVILHRKGAPLSAKKTVTEEKEEVKITERVEVKQEKHQESVVKETASQETTLKGDSTVRTSDGKREVLKLVAALAVFTLVALLLFTFIPGVGDSETKN